MQKMPEKFNDPNAILVGYRGSIAHGMYIEPADDNKSICDIDLMGICIYPSEYYLGLQRVVRSDTGFNYSSRGTTTIMEGDWDIVYYEFLKAIDLLSKGNPNIFPLLFMAGHMYPHLSDTGKALLANCNLFHGRHVYHKFLGFSKSERYKMRNSACQGHLGEKRRRLVNEFGYDPKNAAHSVRLIRMLIDYLDTGHLMVHRPDAEELLDIRTGVWPIEKIDKELDLLAKQAEASFRASKLPEGPDLPAISKLAKKLILSHLRLVETP